MRLLVVSHAYPRFAGDPAGAFIERLCVALAVRGHAVRVVLPTDQGRAGPGERDGVALEWTRYDRAPAETLAYRGTMADALRSPRGLLSFWRLVRALRHALRARAPEADVVHAHWWVPGGWAAAGAATGAGVPYVVTMHGTDVAMLDRVPLARQLARRVLGRAAAVTAVSTYLAERTRVATGVGTPIAVQPMPVVASSDSLDVPASRRTIAFVGRLTGQKRVHLVLEALAQLPPDVTCTIVGDGPERSALESRAATLGVAGRCVFAGAVAPDAVKATLATAGAFAFPARLEGYGLAVAEAVLAGVPVVAATDGGGVSDVVTADAGVLVPPTGDAFAGALRESIENPVARANAVRAGKAMRDRLAPHAVAERFERLLAQVVS